MASFLIFEATSRSRAEEIARRFHHSVHRHYESYLHTSKDCFELPDTDFTAAAPFFAGKDTSASSSDIRCLGNIFAAQCSLGSCK